ncbi:hypothetical protein NLU13_2903 [Sarocladium strictum]|uniref:YDG domain-containing protein n=1 Tax=Sarocladium strictum TaxID=5046 RepID=A0AA39L9T1_SARSR|nr:hypothetical protein NLU13_2903 [Sarocladium strictum]
MVLTASAPAAAPVPSQTPVFVADDEPSLNKKTLRKLCDVARRDKTLGPHAEDIKKVLLAVVKGECTGSSPISISVVRDAHLDKLLADMMDSGNSASSLADEFRANSKIAQSLQKQWQIRFQDNYFRIDDERLRRLTQVGRLKDVEFVGPKPGTRELWQAKSKDITSGPEVVQTLAAGHWWLNLACAHRDGIVGSVREIPTKGRYDHAALPLMTGREDVYKDKVKYSRRGKLAEMHLSLMSRVGKEICVLRGSGLLSPFAPKAGVRYDGKYKLTQYGFFWKQSIGLYELEIEMVRCIWGKDEVKQSHMREVVQIPSPSELDDWKLYEMYESELLRQRQGTPVFMEWYLDRAKRQRERDHWRRLNELRLDLGKLWIAMDS